VRSRVEREQHRRRRRAETAARRAEAPLHGKKALLNGEAAKRDSTTTCGALTAAMGSRGSAAAAIRLYHSFLGESL
jgi:hypothetical protein